MHRRAFVSLLLAALPGASAAQTAAPLLGASPSGSPAFDAWLQSFYGRAAAAGVPAVVLDRELSGLTPDERVSIADGRQPEFSKPVGDYIKGVVTPDRIAIGQRKRQELAFLGGLEQRYGVPRDILIAIWAMESGFGAIQGKYDVVRSMATLAADGRRRGFAEDQLIAALKIIASGEFPRERLIGSWAGAMGQTQFIPTTFLSTAVDGDGDGRRDIWGSTADALASAANLLDHGGWTPGGAWAREVVAPPGFDYSQTEGPRMTPAAWASAGLRPADAQPWAPSDQAAEAMLIAPAGAAGPLFLAFPNHFAIRRYNNSTAYALGVGLLADGFAGRGPLTAAWPTETPLALADRMDAQKALARLGFDPGEPDGVVGVNTRTALRAWQKARGLTADGYLSMEMVRRLRSEAAPL
ncbi:MAG: lytic murein transglycosylase [Phenylobacterium sp.]|uniref:lytic murein transglycosylase n=1 Tax=Phenylobacterium sp. TaxID=1871053 RepID=UPI00391AC4AC